MSEVFWSWFTIHFHYEDGALSWQVGWAWILALIIYLTWKSW